MRLTKRVRHGSFFGGGGGGGLRGRLKRGGLFQSGALDTLANTGALREIL